MPKDAATVTDTREINTNGGYVLFWFAIALALWFVGLVLAWGYLAI